MNINTYTSEEDFSTDDYTHAMSETGVFVAQFSKPIDILKVIQKIGKPHSHNGDGAYVWDIKPIPGKTSATVARSQTNEEFVFHTDCSFEFPPPTYVALYVIQEDRLGGGITQLVKFEDVERLLPGNTVQILRTLYKVKIPKEFFKGQEYIEASIIYGNHQISFRRDCIVNSECTSEQLKALDVLEEIIQRKELSRNLLLKNGSVLFLDNTRYLHARTAILDDSRHLQRIRYW